MLVIAIFLLLQAGGCGGSEGPTTTGENAASTPAQAAAVRHGSKWEALERFAGALSGKLLIPHGPPPRRVLFRDLKLGKGPAIKPNQGFEVHYANFSYKTGKVFENAWRQSLQSLKWNIAYVVDGWIPGLKGMQAGGIRELVLPSSWAYQNGALVYLVKLVKLEPR